MARLFETPLYPYQRAADQDAATPVRHKAVIIGAGPVGLSAAADLALQGVPVLVLDDNDKLSWGSRAICFAKRTLEIMDRLGCGEEMTEKGVVWNLGKVYFRERQVFQFNLLPEGDHRRPAFINLQQYHFEKFLVDRIHALRESGCPVELRGNNKVAAITQEDDGAHLTVETPEGSYRIVADYVIACDGAGSPVRSMLGLDFVGRIFEDNFLIADVVMDDSEQFPVERRFWFDPPFNRGQSALLHKQPDHVWRIDLQLGWDIDKTYESRPEQVIPRLKAFLGEDAAFTLEWVSIYTFQCRRMERFRHGCIFFAGDSAHQVSPFGARGANSGVQDADNLIWKLKLVLTGQAPDTLLDSYDAERIFAADENIRNSTRSTDFITPKSGISRLFRDAVLDLSEHYEAMRPMVNSGRLSLPSVYDTSPLNGPDDPALPARTRPGAPAVNAPLADGWLLDKAGNRFVLLGLGATVPTQLNVDGIIVEGLTVAMQHDTSGAIASRYLGTAGAAVYLLRPDQHIAARWTCFDESQIRLGVNRAAGRV